MNKELVQLKITLAGTEPPVWRRIVVPLDMNMFAFHLIIQVVMGWEMQHPYAFRIGDLRVESTADSAKLKSKNRKSVYGTNMRFRDFLQGRRKTFEYIYDFGDWWVHKIKPEKYLGTEDLAPLTVPVCLDGANNCPPEDIGGIPGYYMHLEILKNPGHPYYDHVCEWMGCDFDPASFDKEEVNKMLASYFKGKEG